MRVNPAWGQMLGYPPQELLGRHFADISHPDDVAIGVTGLRDCLAGRIDGFDMDKRYVHAEGRGVQASVTAALLRDEQGRSQHFATQIIDVTERRALEQARQANEAELADRAQRLQQATRRWLTSWRCCHTTCGSR